MSYSSQFLRWCSFHHELHSLPVTFDFGPLILNEFREGKLCVTYFLSWQCFTQPGVPEHHHPVFNFGAFDESVPCCPPCQGCSDQRALHHRRQSRRKGEVRGVISQSLANDSKLIHQVQDSLRLLVLGVSNLPRQPRGLCKLKIYLPRRGISPAARWAEAGGGGAADSQAAAGAQGKAWGHQGRARPPTSL